MTTDEKATILATLRKLRNDIWDTAGDRRYGSPLSLLQVRELNKAAEAIGYVISDVNGQPST